MKKKNYSYSLDGDEVNQFKLLFRYFLKSTKKESQYLESGFYKTYTSFENKLIENIKSQDRNIELEEKLLMDIEAVFFEFIREYDFIKAPDWFGKFIEHYNLKQSFWNEITIAYKRERYPLFRTNDPKHRINFKLIKLYAIEILESQDAITYLNYIAQNLTGSGIDDLLIEIQKLTNQLKKKLDIKADSSTYIHSLAKSLINEKYSIFQIIYLYLRNEGYIRTSLDEFFDVFQNNNSQSELKFYGQAQELGAFLFFLILELKIIRPEQISSVEFYFLKSNKLKKITYKDIRNHLYDRRHSSVDFSKLLEKIAFKIGQFKEE